MTAITGARVSPYMGPGTRGHHGMDMSTQAGRCAAISWIAGAVIAVPAYVLMRPGVWVLLALLIALLVGAAAVGRHNRRRHNVDP